MLLVQKHSLSCKWANSNVAMLAGKISNLAGLWLGVVARWDLATDVRIKMCCCRGAVSIRGHRLIVDMVHYAEAVRQPRTK